MVSSGLLDSADLVWWQPYSGGKSPRRRSSAWLPWAIEITSNCFTSEVALSSPVFTIDYRGVFKQCRDCLQ